MATVRVAMVGPYPPDGATPTGGIEAVTMNLTATLAQLPGVQVGVVTVVDGMRKDMVLRKNGVTIRQIPSARRWGRATFFLRERRRIVRALREMRPDVVHIQGQNMYAVAGLRAGFPTVVTLHGLLFKEATIADPASGLLARLYRRARGYVNMRWERDTLRQAQDIIIISGYVRRSVEHWTRARLHEIANPISETFFTLTPSEVAGRLLYCGAIEPRKGLLTLIEAMPEIRAAVPEAHLHVVGRVIDDGYHQAVRRAIAALGLQEAVRLMGVIPQDALLREYEQCRTVVLPSQEESSAMVVQQALAAGKAVVATAVGGIPDMVQDGENGFLHRFGDVQGMARSLIQVLRDEGLRTRLGRAGHQQAEDRFRAQEVARLTLNVYNQILGWSEREVYHARTA